MDPTTPGVYSITSKTNARVYFGSSLNIERRWSAHRCALERGKHSNHRLQRHYSKYGLDDLVFAIEEVEPDEVLRQGLETLMIRALYGKTCFNINQGLDLSKRGAARSKMSASQKRQAALPTTRWAVACAQVKAAKAAARAAAKHGG